MTTKIECGISTHQQLSMRLMSIDSDREFHLANVLISRPPRIDMLDPARIFWASLLMFGHRLSGPVVTNLNISEETQQAASVIWGADFSVVQDDQTEVFDVELEDLTTNGRAIAVTTRSESMERRKTNDSVLQVLPIDLFTGTMATLFDIAVTSNAAIEGSRLHGQGGESIGVLTVAACFAPALQADTLVLKEDLPKVELSPAQRSSLEAAGLSMRFD